MIPISGIYTMVQENSYATVLIIFLSMVAVVVVAFLSSGCALLTLMFCCNLWGDKEVAVDDAASKSVTVKLKSGASVASKSTEAIKQDDEELNLYVANY
jgi:hypothetical protein